MRGKIPSQFFCRTAQRFAISSVKATKAGNTRDCSLAQSLLCCATQRFEMATVLSSWKEIARYLGKGVRTVQRWESDHALPVYRPKGSRGIIVAYAHELDHWSRGAPEPHFDTIERLREEVCRLQEENEYLKLRLQAAEVEISGLTSQVGPYRQIPLARSLRSQSKAIQEELKATRERTASLLKASVAMITKLKESSSPDSDGRPQTVIVKGPYRIN